MASNSNHCIFISWLCRSSLRAGLSCAIRPFLLCGADWDHSVACSQCTHGLVWWIQDPTCPVSWQERLEGTGQLGLSSRPLHVSSLSWWSQGRQTSYVEAQGSIRECSKKEGRSPVFWHSPWRPEVSLLWHSIMEVRTYSRERRIIPVSGKTAKNFQNSSIYHTCFYEILL